MNSTTKGKWLYNMYERAILKTKPEIWNEQMKHALREFLQIEGAATILFHEATVMIYYRRPQWYIYSSMHRKIKGALSKGSLVTVVDIIAQILIEQAYKKVIYGNYNIEYSRYHKQKMTRTLLQKVFGAVKLAVKRVEIFMKKGFCKKL